MENQIIIFQDNKPVISNDFKEKYKKFIDLRNQIEDAQKIIKENLLQYFESLPEDERKSIDFEAFKVSYVRSYEKHSFDSAKLKDEDIKTYNKYLKTSTVKSTIKFE